MLNFSFSDTVYRRFIEILCARLSKGCLVVIDIDNLSRMVVDVLAHIFGYKVYWVIQEIPKDFLQNPKKYTNPDYPVKSKQELIKDVQNYYNTLNGDCEPKNVITKFSDIQKAWNKDLVKYNTRRLKTDAKILHISDTHSNVNLVKDLPFDKMDLCIFYGDYVDGPVNGGSREMLDFALHNTNDNFIWLEGNHELRIRKYLGAKYLRRIKKDYLADLLVSTIPEDFFTRTAKEFEDLDSNEAWEYLDLMNRKLKLLYIVSIKGSKFYCSHSGFRFIEQLDLKFIGTVVYGSRNIEKIDRIFSKNVDNKKSIWSIHAHCKYQDQEINKYTNVFNIDPPNENSIILLKQQFNNWEAILLCQEEESI